MHPASVRLLILAAPVFLLGTASVHADPINWTFDANNSSFVILGDVSNLGGVNLVRLNGSFADNQTIPIAAVIASTSPVGNHNDTYAGSPYNVIVDIKDTKSGDPGEFSFLGHLTGFVNPNSANLSSSFDDPLTVHRTLGGHDYAVTIGPFVSPQSPTVDGEIDMTVTIDGAVVQPPPPRNAPEPASLVLCALGLIGGCVHWLRKRVVLA